LVRAKPVRDLVLHASSALLELVRVLQSPSVHKVRQQLELYFALVLSGETQAQPNDEGDSKDKADATSSTDASTTGSNSNYASTANNHDAPLDECVRLLCMLEGLALPALLPPSPGESCICLSVSPAVLKQPHLNSSEMSALRSLVRSRDIELLMLFRFQQQQQKQQEQQQMTPAAFYSRPRPSALFIGATTGTSVPIANRRNHSLADEVRALQARMDRDEADEHAQPSSCSISSGSQLTDEEEEEEEEEENSADEPSAPGPCSSSTASTPVASSIRRLRMRRASTSAVCGNDCGCNDADDERECKTFELAPSADSAEKRVAAKEPDQRCPLHVPIEHARFVFCLREMLAERTKHRAL
jgi:hypothetical protein